jgi:hypothetical protein
MANNQFIVRRVAFGNITIPSVTNSTTYVDTDTYIPAGAIVTGIKVMAGDVVDLNSCAQTVQPRVGSIAIGVTTNISLLPAQTVGKDITLLTTGGMYIGTGGNVNLLIASSSASSAVTADYDFYVEYLYCPDHD